MQTMSDHEGLRAIIEAARIPVSADPAAVERIVARASRPAGRRPLLAPMLAAAIVVLLGVVLTGRGIISPRARPVEFRIEAQGARSVALVGDFNDWDPAVTPLAPTPTGVWTVRVALPAGAHEYAFVIDDGRWVPDPAASSAAGDDFGTPSSLIFVQHE